MSDSLYVGTRKGLFTFGRKGTAWAVRGTAFLGQNVAAVLPDRRHAMLYVALDLGHFGAKMHRSANAGETWEEMPAPTYPPKPEGLEDKDGFGKTIPWRVERLWILEAGHPSQPDVLWAGTIPGGLFRSGDRGQTWHINEALWNDPRRKEWFGGGADLPGLHSICIHPDKPDQVVLGVSCGGVWISPDSGASWTVSTGMRAVYMPPERANDPLIQDAHRVVQCAAQPTHLWVQHHNGVFRSADGGHLWEEVTTTAVSSFGFAVAVHPRDGNTAWLIPAVKDEVRIPVDGRVVVTRTRDGGKTFDVLKRGLPQEHAYDLTFRHALDIDETGNRLAFGSTTGGLWTTDDQGDSWRSISERLPPVHCVRFG